MEWQPIETAPKDGTDFVAYWPDYLGNDSFDMCRTWFDKRSGSWETTYYSSHLKHRQGPTHWMPLPEPPK